MQRIIVQLEFDFSAPKSDKKIIDQDIFEKLEMYKNRMNENSRHLFESIKKWQKYGLSNKQMDVLASFSDRYLTQLAS
jgi:hypothetical protein